MLVDERSTRVIRYRSAAAGEDTQMGDDDVKPPPLPKNTPKDMVDFVDCKSDSVKLKGGAQAWIGKIDLGITTVEPDVTFEKGEKDGTINAVVGKGGFGITLPVSVDANGALNVDTSSLPAGKIQDSINDWVKKFNDHLKAKGKKLGGMTLKDKDVSISKTSLTAMAPGGVKLGQTLLNAPVGAKIGAGVIVAAGLGFGIGFADYSSGTTTTTSTAQGPVAPPPATPSAPTTATLTGGQACVAAQGAGSLITVTVFTTNTVTTPLSGGLSMLVGGQPSGPTIPATGQFTNGQGTLQFPITQFGSYGNFALTSPTLGAVALGPVSAVFPYTVTSDTQPCAQAGTLSAAAPSTTPTSPGVASGATKTVSTTTTSGPPWSLLAIPGSIAVATGVLLFSSEDEEPADDEEPDDDEPDDDDGDGEPDDDDDEPDDDEPDDDDDDDDEPCGCTINVSIEADDVEDIVACLCGTTDYSCEPPDEAVTTLSVTYNKRGSSETTIYQQQFEAVVDPTCTGDGSVDDYVYHWHVDVEEPAAGGPAGRVVLTCTVNATLRCPDDEQRTIWDDASTSVPLYEARPTVQAIHRRADPNNSMDFGHASLRVRCGSMDLVFGFYPPNASVGDVLIGEAVSVAGVEAGGVGVSHKPPVGEHFSGLKDPRGYDIYTFVVDCTQLQKILSYWNNLIDQSARGTLPPYALLWNNCTTQVLESLREAGVADVSAISPSGLSGLDDGANHQVVMPPH
jgi:hypothetical protein